MGNNKKNKSKNKISETSTVSIVTITQISRQETIKLTAEHINNQNYKNIIVIYVMLYFFVMHI